MAEWTKWKVLDYRVPNRHLEMRFDEILDLIANGKLGQSDLVAQPGSDEFEPVSQCAALRFQFSKSFYEIFHNKILFRTYVDEISGLPVNKRTAFVQENYFFSSFYKNKKLELLQKCAEPLKRIMDEKEEINYIFYAVADPGLSQFLKWFFPGSWFLESFVLITNLRVIQAYWNPQNERAESFKSVLLSNISGYAFSRSTPNTFRLELKLYNKKLFQWSGVSATDRVQLEPLFHAFLSKNTRPVLRPYQIWVPNLCKTCYSKLDENTLQCLSCDTEYKSPETAGSLSRLAPGLGLVYGGFRTLGYAFLAGEGILFLAFVFALAYLDLPFLKNALTMASFSLFVIFTHRQSAEVAKVLVREWRPLAEKKT